MGRRCCCGGCVLRSSDDFDRGNSTDLGSKWDEDSGDWSISGNELHEVGTAGALVWSTYVDDKDDGRITVSVLAESVAEGTRHRVIILGKDEDNYYYGQFEGEQQTFRVVVGKVIGGVETELEDWSGPNPPQNALLCLAFNGHMISFTPGETSEGVWSCLSDPGEDWRKIGLANDGTEPIDFDDFEIWIYDYSDPSCYCICSCREYCTPKELIATFTGTGGCAAAHGLDGVTINMSRAEGTWGYTTNWEGEEQVCDCPWCVFHLWALSLTCARPPGNFQLCKTGDTQCLTDDWVGVGFDYCVSPDEYDCDPFVLVFGPYTIGDVIPGQCDCCSDVDDQVPYGTYTITITEAP